MMTRTAGVAKHMLDTMQFNTFSFSLPLQLYQKIVQLRNIAGRFVFGTVFVATCGALDGNRILRRNIKVIDF